MSLAPFAALALLTGMVALISVAREQAGCTARAITNVQQRSRLP